MGMSAILLEFLQERLKLIKKAKNMYLDEIEFNELAKIDYFSQVAREREVQDLILEIEALVKENGFKEGK